MLSLSLGFRWLAITLRDKGISRHLRSNQANKLELTDSSVLGKSLILHRKVEKSYCCLPSFPPLGGKPSCVDFCEPHSWTVPLLCTWFSVTECIGMLFCLRKAALPATNWQTSHYLRLLDWVLNMWNFVLIFYNINYLFMLHVENICRNGKWWW